MKLGDWKRLAEQSAKHLYSLGEMDRDAGFRDGRLVGLLRRLDAAGVKGPGRRSLGELADEIDAAEVGDP